MCSIKDKKNICWITADYFLDCDVEIIRSLSTHFRIQWHIILPLKESRYNECEINEWNLTNIEIHIHRNKYRIRNPLSISFYSKLFQNINNNTFDILYLNYTPSPFFTLVAINILRKNNTIVSAHQGEVYSGFKFKSIYQSTYKLFYSAFKYVILFSESEAEKFKKLYPKSTVFCILLALKDYGMKNISQSLERIDFFNFGAIRPGKNIGLLIDAACLLYEEGVPDFRVTIAGECENWEVYQNKIKYPQIFNLIIRRISNEEVSDMFCRYHYLVLPYSVVTQSGPLKIAYNYNIPVIASNLPGFSNEIINNETGILFESGNVEDLKEKMMKIILNHNVNYQNLKHNLSEYVRSKYSYMEIQNKYISMFEKVIKNNQM